MPESVTNRCTKAHEYLFLLTKRSDYYYDMESVREKTGSELSPAKPISTGKKTANKDSRRDSVSPPGGRNKRSVWTVASAGYPGAHFATYPPKLIEPCILAGTSEYGACVKCGSPWERVVRSDRIGTGSNVGGTKYKEMEFNPQSGNEYTEKTTKTVGWQQMCSCDTEEVRPCIVLDPFIGSGTTCCVAISHGRWSVGIDLSSKYLLENAIPRIRGELVSRPATMGLVDVKDYGTRR
jgi:hypothetical protein